MDPFRELINLSDEDDDDDYDSDLSLYDFEQDFDAGDHDVVNDVGAMHIAQSEEPPPKSRQDITKSFQSCLKDILEVFPDISRDHVQKLHDRQLESMSSLGPQEGSIALILVEKILDGGTFPKERDRVRDLKRKRSSKDADEQEAAKWKYADLRDDPSEYAKVARTALQEAFEFIPVRYILDKFKEHGHYYGAFFAILKAEREHDPSRNDPFSRLKHRRILSGLDSRAMMANIERDGFDFEALKSEIASASQRREREDAQRKADLDTERAEEARDEEYRANGEVMDCGCCCETVTIPRMTHCNGDEPHFFCLDCARRNANNDIGNSQYRLKCMDFSDCDATFSREQRLRFLDEKTIDKLDRLQQQEELRKAELDNLWTCPFCDFAAICPPVEVDREFRCQNPECEEISCRLCKLKSHVPLSCAEHKKENGISERRVIEEARTEALIRTCNKCKVRILKEDGCNKVVCTSCCAMLCDYCGKDITKAMYNHFDSGSARALPGLITAPGGKCPLYDESNKRKDQQVEAAEKDAMAKVRAEHPELSEEDLKIKFAKNVQQSSDRHSRRYGFQHPWIPPLHPLEPYQDPPMPPAGRHYPPFVPPADMAAPAMQHQNQAAELAYAQAQQRLHQAQQQRAQAYHQVIQAQVRQQQMSLLHQQRMQGLGLRQAQQPAPMMQQLRNNPDENQAPQGMNQLPDRGKLFADDMLVGLNREFGANGANGQRRNDGALGFNPYGFNGPRGGPIGPADRVHNPRIRRYEEYLRQRRPAEVQPVARDMEARPEQPARPDHIPRAPRRRNAIG